MDFDFNQPGITRGGSWLDLGDGFLYAWTDVAELGFTAVGTQLVLNLRGAGGTANVWHTIVDGVDSNPAVPAGTLTPVTVFNGAQASRQIRVRTTQGGSIQKSIFGTLTGAPASITYQTGFGFYEELFNPNPTPVVDHTSYIRDDGTLKIVTYGGGYTNIKGHINDATGGTIRFKATTPDLILWMNPVGGAADIILRLAIDGVPQNSVNLGPNPNWNWMTVISGLDGAAEHTYEISFAVRRTSFMPWAVSGSGSMNTAPLAKLAMRVCYLGDSITSGTGTSNGDTCHGYAYLTSKAIGASCRNAGLDFRAVCSGGQGATAGELATAEVTDYDITDVVILLGVNDAQNIWQTYNAATFQTAYQNMLTAIRTGKPSVPIRCLGILDTTKSPAASNRDSVNANIQAAITAVGDGNTFYHNTDGWITPSTDTDDGLHPNDLGVPKVVTRLSPILGGQVVNPVVIYSQVARITKNITFTVVRNW